MWGSWVRAPSGLPEREKHSLLLPFAFRLRLSPKGSCAPVGILGCFSTKARFIMRGAGGKPDRAFMSDVCNLMCRFGALTKCKHFGSFAYRRLFPECVRIASFASDLVFRPPSKNMGLNRWRFRICLCHSMLATTPRFQLFTSIRHFAICGWQNVPF